MRKIIPLLILFVTSACYAAPVNRGAGVPQTTQAAQSPTGAIVSAPTPNYDATIQASSTEAAQSRLEALAAQESELRARETADGALVAIAAMTDANAQRLHEEAGWTATNAVKTEIAQAATATAALTQVPVTETAYWVNATQITGNQTAVSSLITSTADAPILARKMADAENERRFGWASRIAPLFLGMAFVVFSVLVSRWLWSARPNTPAPEALEVPDGFHPIIPFVEIAPRQYVRGEVPIPADILRKIAEGIINERRTLAFDHWRGTEVYKHLKTFRDWAASPNIKFVSLVRGGSGVLDLTAAGEAFFRDCLENCPPTGFTCLENEVGGADTHQNDTHQAVGEGGEA